MRNLTPDLREDYERWGAKIGTEPYDSSYSLGIYDVLKAHYIIVDFFAKEYGEGVGGVGPKNLSLLHSALSRQSCGFDGKNKWSSNLEVCSTLFYGLIKNHPFHDVNKRTAFLSLLYHLRKVKRVPSAKQKDFETLAIRVASNELFKYKRYEEFIDKSDGQVLFIADFLKRNTRPLIKNEYHITYGDLQMTLAKFGYSLENPNGNKIDVVYNTQESYFKGLRRVQRDRQKHVGTIGFPGWTRQVPLEELKKVRRITNLTHENGVDSESFFHDADPLKVLIAQFSEPLRRLADK